MRRGAYLSLAISLSLAACGGGGGGSGGDDGSPFGGDTNNATGDGANGNNGGGNNGGNNGSSDGNTGSNGNGNGGSGDGNGSIGYDPGDGGVEEDSGVISIDIPTPKVNCGGSECETNNNRVCCQSWSTAKGFDSAEQCIPEATCTGMYQSFGDTARAVISTCDGPEDCGAGQVCCFYRDGMPVQACSGFPPQCMSAGPGAGRQCMSIAMCNQQNGLNGTNTGLIACHEDDDCKDVGGTCKSEPSKSITTGANGSGRAGVTMCL